MNTRYDIAAANAREAIEELRLAAYEQGYKDAVQDMRQTVPVSKELTRDEVVEKAKRSIIELKESYAGATRFGYGIKPFPTAASHMCDADFRVNSEKRTVVVLLRWQFDNRILSRGIAKCDPEDCFNVHIGKAIALHRALGIEVPKEILNAPQPTEVNVGDVIKSENIFGEEYSRKIKIIRGGIVHYTEGTWDGAHVLEKAKIIDDSREGE